MDCHGVFGGGRLPPDLAIDLLRREYLAGMLHEEFQNVVLQRGQGHRLIVDGDGSGVIVQRNTADLEGCRGGRTEMEVAAEVAANTHQQLRLLKDPRVQKTMVSITHVETTPDLRYAKVYVSLLDRSYAKEVLAGLKSSGGFLRRALGKSLQLRYTPELQWQEDDSIVHGAHILDILSKLDIPEDTEDETADHS